jgi:hypothetical protein
MENKVLSEEEILVYNNRKDKLVGKIMYLVDHNTTLIGKIKDHKENMINGLNTIDECLNKENYTSAKIFSLLSAVEEYFEMVDKISKL